MVNFTYTVETTNVTEYVVRVLPELEETLLEKLAERLLKHCLQGRRTERANDNGFQRRVLKGIRRRLDAVGICSAPEDKQTEGEHMKPDFSIDICIP